MSTPEHEVEEVREVEEDWLPEEVKQRVRKRPDYQTNNPPCEACQ